MASIDNALLKLCHHWVFTSIDSLNPHCAQPYSKEEMVEELVGIGVPMHVADMAWEEVFWENSDCLMERGADPNGNTRFQIVGK